MNDSEIIPNFSVLKDDLLIRLIPCQIIDFDINSPRSKLQMENQIGRQINLAEFFQLRNIAWFIIKLKNNIPTIKPIHIHTVFELKSKSSKKYRKYFPVREYNMPVNYRFNSFPDIPRSNPQISSFNNTWTFSFIQNNFRVNFFKFISNTLITNYSRSKFDAEIDPRCSYCKNIPFLVAWREDAKHIFGFCPSLTNWRDLLSQALYLKISDEYPIQSYIFLGAPFDKPQIMFYNNIIILVYINIIYQKRFSFNASLNIDFLGLLKSNIEFFSYMSPKFKRSINLLSTMADCPEILNFS